MDAFLKEIGKEKKENTLLSYRRDLTAFFGHFKTEVASLSSTDLRGYFALLSQKASQKSLARAVCVVRQYFAFLKRQGILSQNPMDGLRARDFETAPESLLTEEEFDRLLSYPLWGIRGRRDKAMLALLCEAGVRVSELVQVDRRDLLLSEGAILFGKGERRRTVRLSPETLISLREYLDLSRLQSPDEEALFLGSTGKRMTRQGFWKNLKDRALHCGIEHCSPVTLRHSLARHLISAGEERRQVQLLLGNRDDALLREYEKQGKGKK